MKVKVDFNLTFVLKSEDIKRPTVRTHFYGNRVTCSRREDKQRQAERVGSSRDRSVGCWQVSSHSREVSPTAIDLPLL